MLDTIARSNGYDDWVELLMDYGFTPTVMMPKHKKIELMSLVLNHLRKR